MKPDYIAQINDLAFDLQRATIPIEKRILEAWAKYERLAEQLYPTYDILQDNIPIDFREHSRAFISLLFEFHPGAAKADCEQIVAKDAAYGGSWHKRGGTGAFHALARKGDRVVSQLELFKTFERARIEDKTESIDDTLGDLRRYLILVEAWHVARERRVIPHPRRTLSAEGQKTYDTLAKRFSQSNAETPEEADKRIFGEPTLESKPEEDIPF